jgi:tetratricopeptide (TPR) repeat protein
MARNSVCHPAAGGIYMVDAARIGGSIPCYQHSLPLLGQYLNQQQGARPTIAEVDSGFLVIFFKGGRWTTSVTLTVPHADLLELQGTFEGSTAGKHGVLLRGGDSRNKKHALCPMGYDGFFRALGLRLQRRGAVGVTICDAGAVFYVSYWVDKASFVVRDGRRQAVSSLQLEKYDAAAVKQLLATTAEAQATQMRQYERGLMLNSNDHITTLDAATLFEADGNYREAEELLARIVEAVPEHPEAYYHIARLAHVRGDKRAALAAAKRAVALQPDEPAVANLYGRVLSRSNKKAEAEAALKRAISLEPGNGLFHYHLSMVYEALGRREDAEAEMALCTVQIAAPAREMVEEDIGEIEIRPPAAMNRSVEQLPAESALLPPQVPEDVMPEPIMAIPTMTTTFEPALSVWPPSAAAREEPAALPADQTALPRLTPFPGAVVQPQTPAAWEESPALTLEQRLRLAREAPFQTSTQASRPPSQPLTRRPITQSRLAPPVEVPLGDVRSARDVDPPAPNVTRPDRAAPHSQPLSWSALEVPDSAPPLSPREAASPVVHEAPKSETPAAAPRSVQPVTSSFESPAIAARAPLFAPGQPHGTEAGDPSRTVSAQQNRSEQPEAGAVEIAAEIIALLRAVAADPNRADLHRKLGFLLARQGKTSDAAEEFRKALQMSRTTL